MLRRPYPLVIVVLGRYFYFLPLIRFEGILPLKGITIRGKLTCRILGTQYIISLWEIIMFTISTVTPLQPGRIQYYNKYLPLNVCS